MATSIALAIYEVLVSFDFLEIGMRDLKQKALRGGVARLCGQAINFALRIGFLVLLARLLDPKDFGLVAMVTAVTSLTVIETLAQLGSITVGVSMAFTGFGYWALVGATIVSPAIVTVCLWVITAWIPGIPRHNVEIKSMLHFGGTITLNGLVMYVAYNLEKVLLGRFWGAEVLGIYADLLQLRRGHVG